MHGRLERRWPAMGPRLGRRAADLVATVRAHFAGDDGQGLVEYAFVVMLIALVLILIVAVLGHQTSNLYSNISNQLPR
jgi:pilus assembly protein Flp/PilA